MLELGKAAEALTVDDLKRYPVWRFVNDDAVGETVVKPVKRLPFTSLRGKIVGAEVRLSNGRLIWALLGNLDTRSPRLTKHFRTISLERNGQWFHMARYHDFDYDERGPEAVARFLELPLQEVFPIAVDLRGVVRADDTATLVFNIELDPDEKLSRGEVISLAVSDE
jgi:hypothetical protein